MNTRFLPAVALTWLALACSDTPPGPTPATSGSGGIGGGGAAGAAGGLAGNSGAGTAGAGGTGGAAGGTGGSGGGVTMAKQLKDSGLFTASAMGMLPDGVTVGPMLAMAADVHEFTPQYALWSDDASKRRWVYLPPGKQISTDLGSMDYWQFPAGFKLWKEFSRDGKVIETRILEKTGDGTGAWYMVAFLWNADYTDATAVPMGQPNAMGTMHDVPGEEGCKGCHSNMYDYALGFSALQLSHNIPGSLNLEQITAMGWLSVPPTGMFTLPGTEVEKAAMGYLHANCGHCHNTRGNIYKTAADLALWTHVSDLQGGTVASLRQYLSMVCDEWPGPGNKLSPITSCTATHATGTRRESNLSALDKRIVPGNPAMSAMHELMNLRVAMATEDSRQMPPIGTEVVDPIGMAALEAWINALPVE